MDEIIRGTTPIIEFTFSQILVSNIATAFLEVEQPNRDKIEKPISEATRGQASLSWELSQADTLSLIAGVSASISCIWKLSNDKRGESVEFVAMVRDTKKNEEI